MNLYKIGNGSKTLIATVLDLPNALRVIGEKDTVMFEMEDDEHPGCWDICGVVHTYALEPVATGAAVL